MIIVAKPSCFLAHSFRAEDEYIVTFFTNLLEEHFEVLTAKPEDSTDIYNKIFPKLKTSRACFGIFSKRSKVQDEDHWTPPPDILIETGFALAHGQPIYGFVDWQIEEHQLGVLRFSPRSYPRFDKNALEANRTQFRNHIKNAAQDLSAQIITSFDYTNVTKEVTVYRNGYGVIRNQYTVVFNRDLRELVARHSLGGGRSAKKGYVLPHLAEMLKCGPEVRKDSSCFVAAALVKGAVAEDSLTVEERQYSPERIDFDIKIRGPFAPLSGVTFEWSWGFPDLICSLSVQRTSPQVSELKIEKTFKADFGYHRSDTLQTSRLFFALKGPRASQQSRYSEYFKVMSS